uniref:Uncharacterized protein n=1 Tax=Dromaius novaehollandiae TaxID=8790 RepID=A0A8C4KRJ5_DRONO
MRPLTRVSGILPGDRALGCSLPSGRSGAHPGELPRPGLGLGSDGGGVACPAGMGKGQHRMPSKDELVQRYNRMNTIPQTRSIQSRFLQSRNLNCIALCEGAGHPGEGTGRWAGGQHPGPRLLGWPSWSSQPGCTVPCREQPSGLPPLSPCPLLPPPSCHAGVNPLSSWTFNAGGCGGAGCDGSSREALVLTWGRRTQPHLGSPSVLSWEGWSEPGLFPVGTPVRSPWAPAPF